MTISSSNLNIAKKRTYELLAVIKNLNPMFVRERTQNDDLEIKDENYQKTEL